MKFIIYTTKDASYIVPDEKAKLPKKFEHSYEIECGVEICDKKIKLPKKITKIGRSSFKEPSAVVIEPTTEPIQLRTDVKAVPIAAIILHYLLS